MSLNRSDLRTKIREILREFYDQDTVATGGIDSSATGLPINNPRLYKPGITLQVGSELMIVTTIEAGNTSEVTVRRGAFESTAAAHVATDNIQLYPEFTDRMINLAIDFAIGDTFDRQRGIWIETTDTTLTTSLTVREYTIPAGLTDLARIQVKDVDGNFQENRDWELIGTVIQFKKDFQESGKTIRLIGTSFQALLSSDATNLTISDEQAQFVIYDAAFYAIQQRFANRIKATEYSASVNDRAGQPIELINMARTLKQQVDNLRRREFKERMPRYATRPRR